VVETEILLPKSNIRALQFVEKVRYCNSLESAAAAVCF